LFHNSILTKLGITNNQLINQLINDWFYCLYYKGNHFYITKMKLYQ